MDEKIATFYSQSAFHITLSSLYGVIFAADYEKNKEGKKRMDAYYRELTLIHALRAFLLM